ncbi:unnamed protein product [Acanthoscelides obtectus]|uniref:Uncharacterized protein n=1 Tax=Acanthoscelides obtectus TaxID=200917 RepID=A0A9P0KUG9_ACAOB|nr:unnamed protein product [Acanthoscelides obtectus]CAK1677639.1 hypothetical protein AOBTE_LOCUS31451 [Acanthoscelides obtectus]
MRVILTRSSRLIYFLPAIDK